MTGKWKTLTPTFSNRYPITRKPFPPSICSCMATELFSNSTRKPKRLALILKNDTRINMILIITLLNRLALLSKESWFLYHYIFQLQKEVVWNYVDVLTISSCFCAAFCAVPTPGDSLPSFIYPLHAVALKDYIYEIPAPCFLCCSRLYILY